ncbi:unnamed protein product [Ilex paraguariensis]|uniref:BHLH domain-containing protein n=1 Tax=Ilex paraguariensis TaxID=185542 RepID=A0ABC8TN90_9AQUA
MQPCSREMQALNSLLNQQDLQNGQQQISNTHQIHQSHFDPTSSHDDFLDQMLSSLPPSSWPDLPFASNPIGSLAAGHKLQDLSDQFDDQSQSALLVSKLRQHQISGGGAVAGNSPAAAKAFLLQQQLLLSRGLSAGGLRSPTGAGDSGILQMPLSLGTGEGFDGSQNNVVDGSSFKSPNLGGEGSVEALYNGFSGSLHGTGQASSQAQHFHHPQVQNFGAPATAMNQAPPASGSAEGGAPSQPRQRVRARRGQATDPHSIAERLRRERIAERMKALQELVPNANKTDKASMLDEIIDYVKFLQLQVKVLSMSRLGGAAAVAPLVADMSSEGSGDCLQGNGGRSCNAAQTASSSNDTMTVTEHQVAKLMEEDMGSAMQYLQGKGLCLMPISLATAISTATCHSRNTIATNPLLGSNGEGGPSSPSMSVLTVQSATMGNGSGDASVKDATSVSKP